ncbi:unnamed protein product, partial [Coregonus sp. 'balchen']
MRLLITAARRIHKRPLCSSTSCISSAASCSGAATKSGLQFRDDQLICGSTRELVQRLRGQVDVRMEFISEEEEGALIKELEPGLRKKIYEFDHWDDGGMDRLRAVAFSEGSPLLGPVHILDLDKAGYIKPHIDSVKFCGSSIAGLSLLSDSVMRLVREDEPAEWLDLFLPHRSLYIL